jgi:hypothetical protein
MDSWENNSGNAGLVMMIGFCRVDAWSRLYLVRPCLSVDALEYFECVMSSSSQYHLHSGCLEVFVSGCFLSPIHRFDASRVLLALLGTVGVYCRY